MKHTPGPWHYGAHSGSERGDGSDWGADGLWTADNKLILGRGDGWDGEYQGPRNEADELLIAAAPRLAEALRELLALHTRALAGDVAEAVMWDVAVAKARAALREAGVG